MKKEELELIEYKCTQIVENMNQLDVHRGLIVFNTIEVYKGIEKIAAALHRPVKIKCGDRKYWRIVRYKGITFWQKGSYSKIHK